jgi:hypothetical protein
MVFPRALVEQQMHSTFRLLFQFRMAIPHLHRDIRLLHNSQAACSLTFISNIRAKHGILKCTLQNYKFDAIFANLNVFPMTKVK